jgi:hypothetical protein
LIGGGFEVFLFKMEKVSDVPFSNYLCCVKENLEKVGMYSLA